jgi:hypothetical protein
MQVDEDQLNEILDPANGVPELQVRLGEAIDEALSDVVNHFEFNAGAFGQQMWEGFQRELYDLICEKGKPHDWVSETTSGDVRSVAVAILSAITSRYDMALGVAIPLAGLIIKTGVTRYCSKPALSRDDDVLFKEYLDKLLKQNRKTKRNKKRNKKRRKY